MTKQGTILIVDDNKGVLAAIDMLLSGTFKKVITISNPNRIPAMLETENIDVVLLDMNFSSGINNGNEGIFWLGEIRKISNDLPVVLFTAYADIELAVKTVKEGATDFVVKPWDNAKLIATLLSAYRLRQSQTEVKQLRENEESIRAVWHQDFFLMRNFYHIVLIIIPCITFDLRIFTLQFATNHSPPIRSLFIDHPINPVFILMKLVYR